MRKLFSAFTQWRTRFSLSSTRLTALSALYFTVALNLAFYHKVLTLQPLSDWAQWSFVLTMPLVMFSVLFAVFQLFMLPFLHKIILPTLLVIGSAVSYQSLFFDIYFDKVMLTNVLHTNFSESVRTLTLPFALWVLGLGVLPALLYLGVRVRYRRWWKELLARGAAILVSALVIIAVGKGFYSNYASFFRNNKELVHLMVPSNVIGSSVRYVQDWREANMPFVKQDLTASQQALAQPRVTVLIMGETTRAQNWGLNGYKHQTTPKLAARGQSVINFKNVSSCGTATAVSVPCLFSTMDRENYDSSKVNHQDNLLDIAQRAGLNVLWLDNDMGCKGVCDRVLNKDITALKLAEYCRNGECLDNILLPELDKALAKAKASKAKNTLIVLHTIGSHGPTYYERYTPEYRHFTPTCDTNEINKCSRESLINTYDNTIVYADQFIDNVIQRMEADKTVQSSVIYLSDHGESLGENGVYLHSAPYSIAPKEQTSVPMVMWFSSHWQQSSLDFACLRVNAANQTYSQDNLFSTLYALMGLKLDGKDSTYRAEQDILAPCQKKAA